MLNYIINDKGIVIFHDNKPVKVDKTAPEYHRVIAAFDLPESEQEKAIVEILNKKTGEFSEHGFTINPDNVTFGGERLPTALADKVRSIAQQGLPVKLFVNFWKKLQENPSANSVRELYDFLSYKELPITEDGFFIAYKGVNRNGYSCHGNLNTKVLQGVVDDTGRIENNVGDTIEVLRRDVDDDRDHSCSFGLHVGSLNYAKSFSNGRVLIVKINPADVVSVPKDCSSQKCRVSKYKIIDYFDTEIKSAVCDEDGNEIIAEDKQENDDFVNRVNRYVMNKQQHGLCPLNVTQIQNSFSPEYPSRPRVLDALTELGWVWFEDSDGHWVDLDQ